MSTFKFVLRLIRDAYIEWSHDRAARLGAALAYYALFSLAPLMVIMITIAGSVFGEAAVEGQIVHAISDQIGPQAAADIERLLVDVQGSGSSLSATILSAVVLIFAATNLFSQLKDALNTLWHVHPKPRSHILGGVLESSQNPVTCRPHGVRFGRHPACGARRQRGPGCPERMA